MKKTGLADALGARTTTLELGGKTWTVGQATMADLAALQSEMETMRDHPVTAEDIVMEMSTPRGSTYLLWRVLHAVDNSLDIETVRGMVPMSDPTLGGQLFKVLGVASDEESDGNPLKAAGK